MKIPRKLSLVASMALVLTSAPAWSQPQDARPAARPAERVQEARQQQAKKNAERVQDARQKQQANKNAQRAENARQQQAGKNAQRTENARQQQQAGKNAQRTQDARQQQQAEANAERTQDARNKQQAGKNAQRAQDARQAQQQALNASAVRLLGAEIKKHETNAARIDKLTAIYTRSGDQGKLARVRALQKAEDARYAKVIARFKGSLGEKGFSQVRSRLERTKR